MKRLEIKETYRIDTEENAKKFIEDMRSAAEEEGYELDTYSSKAKVKKQKGEVVDAGFLVTIVKKFNDFWEV